MSQIMTTQEGQGRKDTQLVILKNVGILRENSTEGLGSRRVLPGLRICLWEYTQKVTATLLNGSRKGALENSSHIVKVGVEVKYQYFKPWQMLKETTTGGPNWEPSLNRILLSNSTAGKCAPMQVIKQPEHGKTLTKWSYFQSNYN